MHELYDQEVIEKGNYSVSLTTYRNICLENYNFDFLNQKKTNAYSVNNLKMLKTLFKNTLQ